MHVAAARYGRPAVRPCVERPGLRDDRASRRARQHQPLQRMGGPVVATIALKAKALCALLLSRIEKDL
jgi:hypothetical protein